MRTAIWGSIAVLFIAAQACFGSFADIAESLDETIGKNIQLVSTPLAKLLEIEKATLEKALLETKLKLSDVVLAKLVSDKSELKVEEFLKTTSPDWPKVLAKYEITNIDAEEYLDAMQTEVALMMLDYHENKKK